MPIIAPPRPTSAKAGFICACMEMTMGSRKMVMPEMPWTRVVTIVGNLFCIGSERVKATARKPINTKLR